jgi:lipopolysaccharide/colanic/teichoic acid biosynthesis glycosyltransferase
MIRLLRDLIPSNVLTLIVTEASIVFCCFILATYRMLDVDPMIYLIHDGGLGRILLTELTILLGMQLHGLYSEIKVKSRLLLLQQVSQVMGIAFLAQAIVGYANADLILPRWVMLLGCGLSLVLILSWRFFYSAFLLRALGGQRLLLLGRNDLALQIARHLAEHPELGMRVLGCIEVEPAGPPPPEGLVSLGGVADLREVASRTRPDCIVVGAHERRESVRITDLLELKFSGIRIEDAATTYESLFKRVSLDELYPGQLVYSGEPGARRRRLALQRLYSSLMALAGVLLLSPLILLVILAVRLTSRGPVLSRRTVVGWQGREFALFSFCSRSGNAGNEVTRVGRWLKRLHLERVPQLFNVVRGEMCLVGPQAESAEAARQLAARIPFYRYRLGVRPGLTGWAQAHLGNPVPAGQEALGFAYDLYYIRNMRLALDAYLLLDALRGMFIRRRSPRTEGPAVRTGEHPAAPRSDPGAHSPG